MTTITEWRGRLIIEIDPEPQGLGTRRFLSPSTISFTTPDSAVTAGRITEDWVRSALSRSNHNSQSTYLGELTVEKAQEWGLQ